MDINDPRRHARNTDPETSHLAAEEMAESNASNRTKALRWLYANDRREGWTDFEIESSTPERYFGKCYWKRFSEVRANGWAMIVEQRRSPDTNKLQVATRITQAGREEVELLDALAEEEEQS